MASALTEQEERMIRTPLTPSRTPALRMAAALIGVAGATALAGCAAPATPDAGADGSAPASTDSASGSYKDGTYTAEGTYRTPEGMPETISVTLTLADGVVEGVEVTGDPQARETVQYQGQFIDGIAAVVTGVPIDELKVDRVAGSSLTSGGFNQAVEEIKAQAAE
ncbi:hypothetical protein GCM10017596_15650 [Microbacterium keratanolyticum]|uniref:FMN-binding domain-containing protein n=2 Tax=Microbacterium keratanolyticum TaxID=67574 RepID=A0A9W6M8H3_9MICO|nr:hypothetical protein GCM10017596_15650 [Microbacterium keratanolyticum]